MTAMTAAVVRQNQLTSEGGPIFVYLTGGPNYTYTPAAITGKTVTVISCYDASTAYDAVTASVSAGVITIDAAGTTTTNYVLGYFYR